MPTLLVTLLWIAAIVLVAYVAFWIVGQMKLPEPVNLIARVVVGIVALLLIAGLFVPALGVRFPGL